MNFPGNRSCYIDFNLGNINSMIKDLDKFYKIIILDNKNNNVVIDNFYLKLNKEYMKYKIFINNYTFNLISFFGNIPFSQNLFSFFKNQNIFIPKSFHNKYSPSLDQYKELIYNNCIICNKFVVGKNRNQHTLCLYKLRKIQHYCKKKLYNPRDNLGEKFLKKQMDIFFN